MTMAMVMMMMVMVMVMVMAMVVHEYTNADRIAPPPVNDIAGDCEASRDAVEAIVDVLRAKEVVVAKRANRRGQLSGDLEGDEHGIRSFHVSKAVVFVSAQIHRIHTCWVRRWVEGCHFGYVIRHVWLPSVHVGFVRTSGQPEVREIPHQGIAQKEGPVFPELHPRGRDAEARRRQDISGVPAAQVVAAWVEAPAHLREGARWQPHSSQGQAAVDSLSPRRGVEL